MTKVLIKGHTQIRPRTVTQSLHKAYNGHIMEVLNAYVVGTWPGTSNPITTRRYGETVLCTSSGTWDGDTVTADHYYQFQGSDHWEDVGTRADGDRLLVAYGGGVFTNNLIGDFVGHENELAIWDDGNSAWIFVTPDDGESWTAYCYGDGFWNQMTLQWGYIESLAIWAWIPVSRWIGKVEGNGIEYVGPAGPLSTTDPLDSKLQIKIPTVETQIIADSTGLHHEDKLAHAIRVNISDIVDDSKLQPAGGESAGHVEQVALSGTPLGLWSTFGNGSIAEFNGTTWIEVIPFASLATGMKARISSAVQGTATFTGHPYEIIEWNGSNWLDNGYYDPDDGTLCVQEGTPLSSYEKDLYVWDDLTSAWIAVADSVSVDGNALQESSGVISHVDQMGHSVEPVDYGNITSDARQAANDPAASAYPGETWIVNNWASFTDGEVVRSNGTTWDEVSGSQPSALIQAGSRFTTAASIGGDLTADRIVEVTAIDWVNGNTYTNTVPHDGDALLITGAPASAVVTEFENRFQIWNGTTWTVGARTPNGLAGSGLSVDTTEQLEVNVKTNGGLTIANDELLVGLTALNAISGTNPVADKDYVDQVASGLTWLSPSSSSYNVISDAMSAPPGGESTGDAYIVGPSPSGGWSAFAQGDLVDTPDNGSTWNLLVAGAAGVPADGLRVIITSGTAAGSFTGQENDVADYVTGTGWGFTDPIDGDCIAVSDGVYDGNTYMYDDTNKWGQFSKLAYTAGAGLLLTGQQFSIDTGGAGAVPSAGVSWTSGVTGLSTTSMYCHLNGKMMVYEGTIGNLEAGEFNYVPGTGVVTVSAADTFDGSLDYIEIWGFKS